MKITLTEAYFSGNYLSTGGGCRYTITEGMTTKTQLEVSKMIGDMAFVSGPELAKHAYSQHKYLGKKCDGDYPFNSRMYKIVNPFEHWNKLKSGELHP